MEQIELFQIDQLNKKSSVQHLNEIIIQVQHFQLAQAIECGRLYATQLIVLHI